MFVGINLSISTVSIVVVLVPAVRVIIARIFKSVIFSVTMTLALKSRLPIIDLVVRLILARNTSLEANLVYWIVLSRVVTCLILIVIVVRRMTLISVGLHFYKNE